MHRVDLQPSAPSSSPGRGAGKLALLVVCATLAAAGDAALADDGIAPARATAADTETVVVTATRTAADPFELPFTTHAVGEERMSDERSIRSFPDALAEIPGIYLQRSSYGQASPYLRGFTGFRTLLLIEGIRLNNSVFREGPNQYWSTVDPLTVERVEAVLGPGSVLYGSDAIGGTVNAITRSPDRSTDAPAAAPGAYGRYASAEGSATLRGELGGAPLAGLGVLGGVSWRDFDDLVAGRGTGELPGTAYDELDGDAKLVYALRDDLDLVLGWQRVFQDDVPRTHATADAISFRGTTLGSDRRRDTDQERQLGYAQARYAPRGEWLHDATLSLSYQAQSEEEVRVRGSGAREIQDLDVGTLGLWAQATSPVPYGTLTYGAEWYHDDVQSSFVAQDAAGVPVGEARRGAVADDSRYDLVGLYVQDVIPLGEAFETHLGGRWNLAAVDADDVDPDRGDAIELGPVDESYSALVGSLRGVWRVAEGWRLFAGASQGFRAPTSRTSLASRSTRRAASSRSRLPTSTPRSTCRSRAARATPADGSRHGGPTTTRSSRASSCASPPAARSMAGRSSARPTSATGT
ncbi:MAG: TonB-dependent receptor [Deltaproteobacteria bacterium]|nr:TonB-dependent receptor [Deltaproteobacteria bacterium]